MASGLVSEYNFSNGVECARDVNVENWWVVRLTHGTVTGQNWTDELTVSKQDLYTQYTRECVGDARGVVFFWGNLSRFVPFVSQTATTVTLPPLDLARAHPHGLNLSEHVEGFVATHELSQ